MFQDPGQRATQQAQQEHQRGVNQRFSNSRPPRPGGCLSFLVLVAVALVALGWAGAHGYTPATIVRDIQHFTSTSSAPVNFPGQSRITRQALERTPVPPEMVRLSPVM